MKLASVVGLAVVWFGIAFVLGRWSSGFPVPGLALAPASAPRAGEVQPPSADRSTWPLQLKVAETYFKRYGNDPSSIEFVDWKEPVNYDGLGESPPCDEAMLVLMRARGANGAIVVENSLVYFSKGKVVKHVQDTKDFQFRYELGKVYPLKPAPG